MHLKQINKISYRRFLFSVNDYFLSDDGVADEDINYFIQCRNNINNQLNEFYTLLINLTEPLEVIQQNIYYRTTAEINSFINNNSFEYKLEFNLTDSLLSDFIHLFNQFANDKNIRKAETYRLKAYNKNSILAVSYIKQNNKFVCINFYRVTAERATNLYSFQLKNEFNKTHNGRAHRALHWLDILEFKNLSVKDYDFCGWYNGNSDNHRLNINKFKEQFTTNKVLEYSGVIYKNKFLSFLKKFR